ncbi:tripartite tricarboxylate transporter permease [Caldalkalibacillus thermarum TA2.A1]|uniref:Tripartite tricarboxylate transporter permease n=1 Tax=Caldalkalibacillus thermarum (strain TA2.A1) TaxID=986075 RepID=A0A8X8L997_CALTT|nr:tripartite tricarboxylate transporter permease [Caldalkalibacillus thermarum TA2.A1]
MVGVFKAYLTEKRISKKPEEFGRGSLKGLAAPETANNAACGGSFIPLLTLGIPGSGTTAVLLGALLVVGVQPGPMMLQDHPDVFWGVIASMYVGNIFLLILNLPLIPFIARVLYIPRPMLISLIIIFCLVGVYGVRFNTFDLYLLIAFGGLGFLMRLFSFPAAPFILAFILGGMMEQSFRQALTISNGSLSIFWSSPVSVTLFAVALISLIFPLIRKKGHKKSEQEGVKA